MIKPLPAPLQCPPIKGLEMQAVVIATGYALWLLAGQPFADLNAFRYARTAGEWAWSLALLIGVLLYFAGVGLWRCWVRQLGLVTIGLVWLLMALLVFAADMRLPGIWTLVVLGASAVCSAIRLIR